MHVVVAGEGVAAAVSDGSVFFISALGPIIVMGSNLCIYKITSNGPRQALQWDVSVIAMGYE